MKNNDTISQLKTELMELFELLVLLNNMAILTKSPLSASYFGSLICFLTTGDKHKLVLRSCPRSMRTARLAMTVQCPLYYLSYRYIWLLKRHFAEEQLDYYSV